MYRKHFLPHMWEANFASPAPSDPDLFAAIAHEPNFGAPIEEAV